MVPDSPGIGFERLRFELLAHRYGSRSWPVIACRLPGGLRAISSSPLGGGMGARRWVVNAQVPPGYSRRDPAAHLAVIASRLGLSRSGVGMLTAAEVIEARSAREGGVEVVATVGTDSVVPAARVGAASEVRDRVGTINVVVMVPAAMSDAAMVNAIATATEAKSQALADAGFSGTGTPTDALCILCPTRERAALFAGPRSRWGSRIALAVHRAVLQGALA